MNKNQYIFYFSPAVFNQCPYEFIHTTDICKLVAYASGVKLNGKIIKCASPIWSYNTQNSIVLNK